MNRRDFLSASALTGLLGSTGTIQASSAVSLASPPKTSTSAPVYLIGIGDGGCRPLLAYHCTAPGDESKFIYLHKDPRSITEASATAHVVSLNYAPAVLSGLDTFEDFNTRLRELVDDWVACSNAVIPVYGLGHEGFQMLVAAAIAEAIRRHRKRTIAIVSLPFGFEGSLRACTGHGALRSAQKTFDWVEVVQGDDVFDRCPRPVTMKKAYATLSEVMAHRIQAAYSILKRAPASIAA